MDFCLLSNLLQCFIYMYMMIVKRTMSFTEGNVYLDCDLPHNCPSNTQEYLTSYGYLDPDRKCTRENIETGLRIFQEFNIGFKGSKVTGQCCRYTLNAMKQRRCGNEDIERLNIDTTNTCKSSMQRICETKWNKHTLTWTVEKFPSMQHNKLSSNDINKTMGNALQLWAEQIPLTFNHIDNPPADITIRFDKGRHTTRPFHDFDDNIVLAHTSSPPSVSVHFNDAIHFVLLRHGGGPDLYYTAVHQFGHALGLSHSNIKQSIMSPLYSTKPNKSLKLHTDDVAAIRALYGGKKGNPSSCLQRPMVSATVSDYNFPISASFRIDNVTYIFIEERIRKKHTKTFVYKVTSNGLVGNSKRPIEEVFRRQNRGGYLRPYPYTVDASAYVSNNKHVYLFKVTKVYRYVKSKHSDTFILDEGHKYPRWLDVSEFPERPRAAASIPPVCTNNERMLLFGCTMVWEWQGNTHRIVGSSYPISRYGRSMPEVIDSAYYDDDTHIVKLFKGDKFYNFDVHLRRVVDTMAYDIKRDFFKN